MIRLAHTISAGRLTLLIIFLIFSTAFANVLCAADNMPIFLGFDGAIDKRGLPNQWLLKVNTGRAQATVLRQKEGNLLYLKSESSSFSVERSVSVPVRDYPYVSWSWKATRLPLSGDVRKKTHNDQGLQMLLAFENSKVISYVWDVNAPEGTVTDESLGWPLNISVKVIVVRSGTGNINEWVSQRRNVYEDYINLFHEDPPPIKGLRIQTNTQYTRGSSEGMFRGIIFGGSDECLKAQSHGLIDASPQSYARK